MKIQGDTLIVFTVKWHLGDLHLTNSTILPRVDYGAAVKLEITYTGQVTWAKFDNDIYNSSKFDFVLKFLVTGRLLLQRVVSAIVDLLDKT